MTTWQLDEGPMRLKEEITVTVTTGVNEQDRLLLERLGLQFNASGTECTFPTGKGIMTLPPQISDETFNEEHTHLVAHTLMKFFQVGDVLVCVSTRFTLLLGGKAQPQWTTLSVLATSPAAQSAHTADQRTLIPLATLIAEAEQVAREEAEQSGSTSVIDAATIMSRIASFMETVPNEQGGIEGVLVWPGWQQALRRKS